MSQFKDYLKEWFKTTPFFVITSTMFLSKKRFFPFFASLTLHLPLAFFFAKSSHPIYKDVPLFDIIVLNKLDRSDISSSMLPKTSSPNSTAAQSSTANTLTDAETDENAATDLNQLDPYPFVTTSSLLTKKVKIKKRPNCSRTDLARENGTTGSVRVSLIIDEKGRPQNLVALDKLEDGLSEMAIECISKTEFFPAEINGKLVSTQETMTINFKSFN